MPSSNSAIMFSPPSRLARTSTTLKTRYNIFVVVLCTSSTTNTIFKSKCRETRGLVYDEYLNDLAIVRGDKEERWIYIEEDTAFYKRIKNDPFLQKHFDPLPAEPSKQLKKSKMNILRRSFQEFWTSLH